MFGWCCLLLDTSRAISNWYSKVNPSKSPHSLATDYIQHLCTESIKSKYVIIELFGLALKSEKTNIHRYCLVSIFGKCFHNCFALKICTFFSIHESLASQNIMITFLFLFLFFIESTLERWLWYDVLFINTNQVLWSGSYLKFTAVSSTFLLGIFSLNTYPLSLLNTAWWRHFMHRLEWCWYIDM